MTYVIQRAEILAAPLRPLRDWCFIAEGRPRDLARRWPLHLALTGFAAAAVLWASLHPDPAAGFHLETVQPWQYLRWQAGVVAYYLRLLAVPDRLCFDCGYLGPWPVEHSALAGRVWLPGLGLAAAAMAAWRVRARFPLVAFAVLGTAVALAPTSSVFPLTDA